MFIKTVLRKNVIINFINFYLKCNSNYRFKLIILIILLI